MSIYWAVATGPGRRSGKRQLFSETIRPTRRDAIRAYDSGDPRGVGAYAEDRRVYGIEAVKVEVTEAPRAR